MKMFDVNKNECEKVIKMYEKMEIYLCINEVNLQRIWGVKLLLQYFPEGLFKNTKSTEKGRYRNSYKHAHLRENTFDFRSTSNEIIFFNLILIRME